MFFRMGIPGRETWKPAADVASVVGILLGISSRKPWFFIKADKEVKSNEDDCEVLDHLKSCEEKRFAEDRGKYTDVHRVANIAVKPADDKVFRRRGGDEGAAAHTDEAHDGLQERRQSSADKNECSNKVPRGQVIGDAETREGIGKITKDQRRTTKEREESGDNDVCRKRRHTQAVVCEPERGGGLRMSPST